jgi:hypothetical protein
VFGPVATGNDRSTPGLGSILQDSLQQKLMRFLGISTSYARTRRLFSFRMRPSLHGCIASASSDPCCQTALKLYTSLTGIGKINSEFLHIPDPTRRASNPGLCSRDKQEERRNPFALIRASRPGVQARPDGPGHASDRSPDCPVHSLARP